MDKKVDQVGDVLYALWMAAICLLKETIIVLTLRRHVNKDSLGGDGWIYRDRVPAYGWTTLTAVYDSFQQMEVCVDNLASVSAAWEGGAHRIELCSSLAEGGLTPTPGMAEAARALIKAKAEDDGKVSQQGMYKWRVTIRRQCLHNVALIYEPQSLVQYLN